MACTSSWSIRKRWIAWYETSCETIRSNAEDTEFLISILLAAAIFQATRSYENVERRMLPLIFSWAVTVYKLQGTVSNTAVIDLRKRNFAKGQVPVAVVEWTVGWFTLWDLDPSKLLKERHDEKPLKKMLRFNPCI